MMSGSIAAFVLIVKTAKNEMGIYFPITIAFERIAVLAADIEGD